MSVPCTIFGHAPSIDRSTLDTLHLGIRWTPKDAIVPSERGVLDRGASPMKCLVTCRRCDVELGYITVDITWGDAEAKAEYDRILAEYKALIEHFGTSPPYVKNRLGWQNGLPADIHDYTANKVIQLVMEALLAEHKATRAQRRGRP